MLCKRSGMNVVYGPFDSWRLGYSIGIDPICMEPKVCTCNCIYCLLGDRGIRTACRCEFVKAESVRGQLRSLMRKGVEADAITFSGTGEPTLSSNLGDLVEAARSVTTIPLGILTNSSLLDNPDVRKTLATLDRVVAKLDAAEEELFKKTNRPHESVKLESMLAGLRKMRDEFRGEFGLQIMFVKENMKGASSLVDACESIDPDIIYLDTPLRPCAVEPLGRSDMARIHRLFAHLNARSVYDAQGKEEQGRRVMRRLRADSPLFTKPLLENH